MAALRNLGGVVALLCLVPAVPAQTYALGEAPAVGECFKYHLDMSLAGELRVSKDGARVPISLKAAASHDFSERVLLAANGQATRSARHYDLAKATVTVNGVPSERTLRPEHCLQVAQRTNDRLVVYCPAGPLTRAELQLTGEHLDTLVLTGLLAGKAVAVGDTWKPSAAVLQALCAFEGLTEYELICKLEEVKDNVARVSLTGKVNGIDLGAVSRLTITGSYSYDVTAHRLVAVEWVQKDDRDQGPASPAIAVETTTRLTRALLPDCPESLSDVKLVSVPEGDEVPENGTLLCHHDAKQRYELTYAREWQTVGETESHLVLRLLDRGDFVAQASVMLYPKAEAGKHLTAEEFQQAMSRTTGWEQEEVLQAGEVTSEGGKWVYRIAAVGQMDGLKVVQNFYLVAGPDGDQAVISFMMTPKQAEKLGTRDLTLVSGLTFPKKP